MTFLITYEMTTGTGRLEVRSALQVLDIVEDLRRAGAWSISVRNRHGRFIMADDLGSAAVTRTQVPYGQPM